MLILSLCLVSPVVASGGGGGDGDPRALSTIEETRKQLQREQDSIANAVAAQDTLSDPVAGDDEVEPENTAGIVAGLISIFNEARQAYTDGKLMGLIFYLLGLWGTIKGVYLMRSWAWIRKYFIMQDIKTIVKGVSLVISILITFIVGKGVFDVERFIMLASIIYIASDPLYNLLVSWGWVKRTPKVIVSGKV